MCDQSTVNESTVDKFPHFSELADKLRECCVEDRQAAPNTPIALLLVRLSICPAPVL